MLSACQRVAAAFDVDFYADMSNLEHVLGTLPGYVPRGDDEDSGAGGDAGVGAGDVAAVDTAYLHRSSRFLARFHKLNSALCELVQDYGMVSYTPLSIEVRVARGLVREGGGGMAVVHVALAFRAVSVPARTRTHWR